MNTQEIKKHLKDFLNRECIILSIMGYQSFPNKEEMDKRIQELFEQGVKDIRIYFHIGDISWNRWT